MSIAVLFPDVEQFLCDALPSRMAAHSQTVTVGTRVPNPRPAKFLRVLATGGDRGNIAQDRPTVIIEAWAATESDASLLARTARAVIESLADQVISGVTVYRARDFSAPVNLPDPDSTQVRYTFQGPILLRGAALT